MRELCCDDCGAHIGWETNGGPRNWVQCDDCNANQKEDE